MTRSTGAAATVEHGAEATPLVVTIDAVQGDEGSPGQTRDEFVFGGPRIPGAGAVAVGRAIHQQQIDLAELRHVEVISTHSTGVSHE